MERVTDSRIVDGCESGAKRPFDFMSGCDQLSTHRLGVCLKLGTHLSNAFLAEHLRHFRLRYTDAPGVLIGSGGKVTSELRHEGLLQPPGLGLRCRVCVCGLL